GGLAWMAAVVGGLAALVHSSEEVYAALRYLGAAYLAYLGLRSLWGWWRSRGERVPAFDAAAQGGQLGADDGGRGPSVSPGAGRDRADDGGRGPSVSPEAGRARADDGVHARTTPSGAGRATGAGAPASEVGRDSWWAWARQGLVTNLLNAKLGAFLVAFFPQFSLPGLSPVTGNLVLAAVFWGIALVWFGIVLLAIRGLGPRLARPAVRLGAGRLSGAILVGMARPAPTGPSTRPPP